MNRIFFSGALVCVLFLLAGTFFFPGDSLMWLASMSLSYTLFRLVIVGMLLAILLTVPPRKVYMRVSMGTIAIILLACGVYLSLSDSVHLLDIALFYALGFTFGVEALELTEEETEQRVETLRTQYVQRIAQPSEEAMRQLLYLRVLIDHYAAR